MTNFSTNSLRIRLVLLVMAMLTCAAFAPWWGTPIVAAVCYVVFLLPTRTISTATFFAWALTCYVRDTLNMHGPSRVFSKLLSIDSVGFPNGSLASRACVYGLVGGIGFLLALFTGSALKSFIALFPSKLKRAQLR